MKISYMDYNHIMLELNFKWPSPTFTLYKYDAKFFIQLLNSW